MKKMNNPNININKDDQNINDFLYCWSELGLRPSKTNIYKNYKKDQFLDFFSDNFSIVSTYKDVFPLDELDIINDKQTIKISDNIWLSYTIFDSLNDDGFIGEVCFYYNQKESELVEKYITDLDDFVLKDLESEHVTESNLFTITINQNGFDLETISNKVDDFENIDLFYNDSVLKNINKLSKNIKNCPKGLSIVYGDRGTGKTSIVKYISNKISSKKFIFIPTTYFDISINNPEFRNFLKKQNNSVIILDDCEIYFSDIYSKSNIFTNNILQLVDGFDSDDLGLNLILILNCQKENDIDFHLLESNNLLDIIEINPLQKDKIIDLCKFLKTKKKYKRDTKLIDILKNKSNSDQENEIGF